MGSSTANTIIKLATGLAAGLLLSACSAAGLARLMPMKPAPRPVAVATATPTEAVPYEPLAAST